jgi:serine/threonine-protein phosphatase PGAM5
MSATAWKNLVLSGLRKKRSLAVRVPVVTCTNRPLHCTTTELLPGTAASQQGFAISLISLAVILFGGGYFTALDRKPKQHGAPTLNTITEASLYSSIARSLGGEWRRKLLRSPMMPEHLQMKRLFEVSTASLEARQAASDASEENLDVGSQESGEELFYDECWKRQVATPRFPYPAWDYNWDGRAARTQKDQDGLAEQTGTSTIRHILLIRHGQYEQGHASDHERVLTPLGRRQAEYTGQRLAKMMKSFSSGQIHPGQDTTDRAGPIFVKAIHVSGMKRAQETADIIVAHLNSHLITESSEASNSLSSFKIIKMPPDPLLNETIPSPVVPRRADLGSVDLVGRQVELTGDRVEKAFLKYIHRSMDIDKRVTCKNETDESVQTVKHEFEVIVGHGNIIRYFLLRALQLPPEAWLRFSVFNCSITYLMIYPDGRVTARLVGDTGHIPYEETSFSGSHGYNWQNVTDFKQAL